MKKAFTAKLEPDLFENFKSITRENGFKQLNEAIEILMQKVVDGEILLTKQTKVDIKVNYKN